MARPTRSGPSATKEALRAEAFAWAERIKVRPRRIQIQAMTTKWASCSTRGTVTLSLDLLAEPRPFREVVIVHELIHVLVPNHGRVFKALMKAYLPDWERVAAGRVSRSCSFQGQRADSPAGVAGHSLPPPKRVSKRLT